MGDSFKVDLHPKRGASLLITIGAVALSLLTSLLARYGFDFGAWRIAITYFDCFAISLLIFCFPVALLIDKGLAYYDFRKATRWAILSGLGLALGLTTLLDTSPVEATLGQPLPTNATLLSSRSFTSGAGGGEEYWFVQFRMNQADFDEFAKANDLRLTENATVGSTALFAIPLGDTSAMPLYRRTWGNDFDNTFIYYDPATGMAHAMRIRG